MLHTQAKRPRPFETFEPLRIRVLHAVSKRFKAAWYSPVRDFAAGQEVERHAPIFLIHLLCFSSRPWCQIIRSTSSAEVSSFKSSLDTVGAIGQFLGALQRPAPSSPLFPDGQPLWNFAIRPGCTQPGKSQFLQLHRNVKGSGHAHGRHALPDPAHSCRCRREVGSVKGIENTEANQPRNILDSNRRLFK